MRGSQWCHKRQSGSKRLGRGPHGLNLNLPGRSVCFGLSVHRYLTMYVLSWENQDPRQEKPLSDARLGTTWGLTQGSTANCQTKVWKCGCGENLGECCSLQLTPGFSVMVALCISQSLSAWLGPSWVRSPSHCLVTKHNTKSRPSAQLRLGKKLPLLHEKDESWR